MIDHIVKTLGVPEPIPADVDRKLAVLLLAGWRDGRGPAYLRLARALSTQIRAGRLAVGSRLPTERDLARSLGVSRTSVVSAYSALREEGAIVSRQGAGTWVAGEDLPAPKEAAGPPLLREVGPDQAALCDFASGIGTAHPWAAEVIAGAGWLDELAQQMERPGYLAFGLPALREAIADHYRKTGLPTRADQIVVTTGAQQALSVIATALAEPGGLAGVQNPTYSGALDAFAATGLLPVPLAAGPDVDGKALAYAMTRHRLRLAYLIPTCHSPTGAVMSLSTREEVASVAAAHDVPIVDDTTLAGLRLAGDPPPVLASFAPTAPILTVGSLSKLTWPGLRIGWIRVPDRQLAAVAAVKKALDLGTSVVSQVIAARLVAGLPEAAARRRERLLESLDCIEKLLRDQLPEWRWHRPDGGYLLWIALPAGDGAGFAAVAQRYGVPVLPGWLSSPNNTHTDRIRLCYSHPPELLRQAVPRLAQAWRAYLS
jgi:DNA-binding transcriptional MocR family regulator